MKTRQTIYAVFTGAVLLGCLPARDVSAQSGAQERAVADADMHLVVPNQIGTEARFSSRGGVVEPISVLVNERLPFSIEVSRSKAGYPVMIGDLDGAQINAVINEEDVPITGNTTPPSVSVSERGLVELSFQAGSMRGLYRVLVRIGIDQYQLQVYVVDPNRLGRPQH
jgi:hypothetical protein